MSSINGIFTCDRCGIDLENGGVDKCIVVNDMIQEISGIVNYHFCRVNGCATIVLNKTNLKNRIDKGLVIGKATKEDKR